MPVYLEGYEALECEMPVVVITDDVSESSYDVVNEFETNSFESEYEVPTIVITNGVNMVTNDTVNNFENNNLICSGIDLYTEFKEVYKSYNEINTFVDKLYTTIIEKDYSIENEFKFNDVNYIYDSTLIEAWYSFGKKFNTKIPIDLYIFNKLINTVENLLTCFRINIGVIPDKSDIEVCIYLAAVKYFNIQSDLYCTLMSDLIHIIIDLDINKGRILGITSDYFSSGICTCSIDSDLFSTDEIYSDSIFNDIITISGNVIGISTDYFCSRINRSNYINNEIKIRSLFINDFFLKKYEFDKASVVSWVDVIDYIYPINEDNTYLLVNGVMASGIYFEDIGYGKRLYYDPIDDFYSNGEFTFTIHAESVIGEIIEESFYLLHGYNLIMNENVIWPPNYEVFIRAEAKNNAFCKNTEALTFSFETKDYDSFNLPVSINAVSFMDMSVSIYPQSTTFFYGKTYTVKVLGVKDFAGNEMEDFEYTFTIEDPNKK